MIETITRQEEFISQLKQICPTDGCAYKDGAVIRIDFGPEATQEQKDAAWSLAQSFDFEAPSALAVTETGIRTIITALKARTATNEQVQEALDFVLSKILPS
jgi:hypothetical protein